LRSSRIPIPEGPGSRVAVTPPWSVLPPPDGAASTTTRASLQVVELPRTFSSSPFIAMTVWVIAACGLRSDRVDLAQQLLREEPSCFPRPVGPKRLLDVCVSQPHELSVMSTRRPSGRPRRRPLLIHLHAAASSATAFFKPRLRREPLGARCSIARAPASSAPSRPVSSGRERRSSAPHPQQLADRPLGNRLDIAPLRRGDAS